MYILVSRRVVGASLTNHAWRARVEVSTALAPFARPFSSPPFPFPLSLGQTETLHFTRHEIRAKIFGRLMQLAATPFPSERNFNFLRLAFVLFARVCLYLIRVCSDIIGRLEKLLINRSKMFLLLRIFFQE